MRRTKSSPTPVKNWQGKGRNQRGERKNLKEKKMRKEEKKFDNQDSSAMFLSKSRTFPGTKCMACGDMN